MKKSNANLLIFVGILIFIIVLNITNTTQISNSLIQRNESNNEETVFIDINDILNQQSNPNAMANGNTNLFPIFYESNDLYANSAITKVMIPVSSITSLSEDQIITLHVADKSILSSRDVSTFMNSDLSKSYKITIPSSVFASYSNVNIKENVEIDVSSYNITAGENEVIGFGDKNDTITWNLRNAKQNSETLYPELYLAYTSSNVMTSGGGSYSLLFNFKKITKTNEDNNSNQEDGNDTNDIEYVDPSVSYEKLNGKNISILGDSISTFKGYSNNAGTSNSTIASNNVYYNGANGLSSVNETWWMQAISATNMNLLVNNSWSGSSTIGSLESSSAGVGIRTQNLHDDTGDNANTMPDIIAIYMGTNDLAKTIGNYSSSNFFDSLYSDNEYIEPTTFSEAYAIMLDRVSKKYPNAQIYTFTILANNWVSYIKNEELNNAIKLISDHYSAEVVDIYSKTGITSDNAGEYMLSNESTHIHPNSKGMDLITKVFLEKLITTYEETNSDSVTGDNNEEEDVNDETSKDDDISEDNNTSNEGNVDESNSNDSGGNDESVLPPVDENNPSTPEDDTTEDNKEETTPTDNDKNQDKDETESDADEEEKNPFTSSSSLQFIVMFLGVIVFVIFIIANKMMKISKF